MNSFALVKWDDEGELTTFYTVHVDDGSTENEADKFFDKYYKIDRLKEATQDLHSFLLDIIGDEYGAIDDFFNRSENLVYGLPHTGKVTVEEIVYHYQDFPLRIYALRVNNREDLVILFNGGEKTAWKNSECADLNIEFNEAQIFAQRIEDALRAGLIVVDGRYRRLISFDGSEEIIL